MRPRVVEIERGRVHFGADQEHVPVRAILDQGHGRAQAVQETGTLIAHVQTRNEAAHVAQTELALEVDAGTWKHLIRRESAEDDHVDVGLLQPGPLDGLFAGMHGQVGAGHALVRETTLLDATALLNPLVVGVDAIDRAQIVVGDDARRSEESGSRDIGVGHVVSLPGSCCRALGSPGDATHQRSGAEPRRTVHEPGRKGNLADLEMVAGERREAGPPSWHEPS